MLSTDHIPLKWRSRIFGRPSLSLTRTRHFGTSKHIPSESPTLLANTYTDTESLYLSHTNQNNAKSRESIPNQRKIGLMDLQLSNHNLITLKHYLPPRSHWFVCFVAAILFIHCDRSDDGKACFKIDPRVFFFN